MIPAAENVAGDLTTDPMKAYRAGQIEGLTDAEREALDNGADISQVVNARRGTYVAGGKRYTREGTTRRGFAGNRLGSSRIARLTPEQLFADATSREDAIRLLRQHGYIL